MDSKSQRNGVQDELKRLREQQVARNQREKLKERTSLYIPLLLPDCVSNRMEPCPFPRSNT